MKTIVYTYGVFDLIHSGHVLTLREAYALGDLLAVGVFSDIVAKNFKRLPINDEVERFFMVETICGGFEGHGAKVMMQNDFSPEENLKKIKESFRNEEIRLIVAKGPGAGWSEFFVPSFEGAEVKLMEYHDGISTSEIIRKCRERDGDSIEQPINKN